MKDATFGGWRCYRQRPSFYPRAREGRDELRTSVVIDLAGFYPRAREGRDA